MGVGYSFLFDFLLQGLDTSAYGGSFGSEEEDWIQLAMYLLRMRKF